jgi:hypothetical protein
VHTALHYEMYRSCTSDHRNVTRIWFTSNPICSELNELSFISRIKMQFMSSVAMLPFISGNPSPHQIGHVHINGGARQIEIKSCLNCLKIYCGFWIAVIVCI